MIAQLWTPSYCPKLISENELWTLPGNSGQFVSVQSFSLQIFGHPLPQKVSRVGKPEINSGHLGGVPLYLKIETGADGQAGQP